jgi:ribosomal protein L11 methyltransferase
VGERDWVRDTQAQFAPQSIGRLWIVPSWHTPPADAQAVLRLDPGVAFGTGSHPTTRLCLAWLEGRDLGGCRLLDYGCGSGILGIAALRLGAAAATATDIDPQALETAAQNARANGVALAVCAPDHLAGVAGGPFDIVVANILAVPLMVLAPVLAGLLRPGGTLLLSGILERQLEDVVAAYRASPAALTLEVAGVEDGWVALAGSAAAAG